MATCRIRKEQSAEEAQGKEESAQSISSTAVQNEIVNFHNTLRSQVSPAAKVTKPTARSAEAAKIAQAYVNQCVWGHSRSASRSGMGENIAMSTGTAPTTWTTAALKPWADEKAGYKYPGAGGSSAGHHTQMIWADSTGVGCGFKRCPASSNPAGSKYGDWNFYVCNYTPAQVAITPRTLSHRKTNVNVAGLLQRQHCRSSTVPEKINRCDNRLP